MDTTNSLMSHTLEIQRLLAGFREPAFICYHGELWLNARLNQLLGHPDNSSLNAIVPSNLHQLLSKPGSYTFELQLNANQQIIQVETLLTPYTISGQHVSLGLVINHLSDDSLEQDESMPRIRIVTQNTVYERHRASVTLESISDGIISIDSQGLVDYMNSTAEVMTGVAASEAIDRKLKEILVLEDAVSGERIDPTTECFLSRFTNEDCDDTENMQILIRHRDINSQSPVEVLASPIRDENNQLEGIVIVIHDVSDLHHMSRQIIYQASHDSLTGLYNRGEFERQLKQVLFQLRLQPSSHVLCYIDLDKFKIVNDTCGHLAGDELLRQISAHIKSHTKDRDIVGRLGGDEFGLLLKDCDMEYARDVTERIRQSVKSHRFEWDHKTFYIGASIGVMTIDENSGTLDDILSAVDSACYNAKNSGRDQVNFITESSELIQQRHTETNHVEHIKHALAHDCFQLYSQPIAALDADINSGQFQELLLRMQTKDQQIIEPREFLSTAERYHMMPEIDRWVIAHALIRLSDSEDPLNDDNTVLTCINISSQSINDKQFIDDIKNLFKNSPVPPNKICFEISEATVASNISGCTEFMLALSAIGIHFSIDNFCNSLSSFSYLKKLPIDFLKIDGRFMHNLIEDEVDSALIGAIRDITNILGIQTIAESVEDQYTFNALKTLGIDYAQGFFIAEPKSLLQQYEQRLSSSLNIH